MNTDGIFTGMTPEGEFIQPISGGMFYVQVGGDSDGSRQDPQASSFIWMDKNLLWKRWTHSFAP